MNRYLEQKILMADPVELIRVVHQATISWLREAREHLRNKRIAERANAINRAYLALEELLNALDTDAAPELAGQLRELYLYMQSRLVEANARQEDAPLADVLGLLTTLSEAWVAIPEKRVMEESGETGEARLSLSPLMESEHLALTA